MSERELIKCCVSHVHLQLFLCERICGWKGGFYRSDCRMEIRTTRNIRGETTTPAEARSVQSSRIFPAQFCQTLRPIRVPLVRQRLSPSLHCSSIQYRQER